MSGTGGQRGGTYGGLDGIYRRGQWNGQVGQLDNGLGLERALRDSVRELNQMRSDLRGQTGADLDREIENALKELQRYDPSKIGTDPVLQERISSTVLPTVENLELQLRRKLEGRDAGQVRTSAVEKAPQGYADAVAEYFRRLSRGKK